MTKNQLIAIADSIAKKNLLLGQLESYPKEMFQEIGKKAQLTKVLMKVMDKLIEDDEEIPTKYSPGIQNMIIVNDMLNVAVHIMIEKLESEECQKCGDCLDSLPMLKELIAEGSEPQEFNITSPTIGTIQ
jgi:hypothetical protein